MSDETPKVDEYDAQHGKPEASPPEPKISEEEKWGLNQNPVRETPTPFKNLQKAGG